MAIRIGNKEYYSYEEQILENKKEIEELKEYRGIVRYIEVPLELGFRFERDVEYLMTNPGPHSHGGYTGLQGKFHNNNGEPIDMPYTYWIGGISKTFKWTVVDNGNSLIMYTTLAAKEEDESYIDNYGEAFKYFNTYTDNPLDYIEISSFQEGQRLFIVDRSGL